jgi:regulator of replication initiation timing
MLSQLSDQLKECAQAMQSQYDNNIVIENENKNLREEINRLSKGRSQQEENNDPNALHYSSKFIK